MSVLLGLNGATLPTAGAEEAIRAAREAGFRAFEPRVPLLAAAEAGGRTSAVRESLAPDLAWLPLNAVESLFAIPREEISARAGETCSLAARFRVPQAIFVPGSGAACLAFAAALAELGALRDVARRHGVAPLYELIGFPTFAFPSLDQAYRLARGTGIPLVLDTFHLAISRTRPEEIARLPGAAIGLVHLSDAITSGKAIEELRDEDRVLPGEGGLPVEELLVGIRRTGYRGPVSVEVFHPRYGEREPRAVAKDAFHAARAALASAGWAI